MFETIRNAVRNADLVVYGKVTIAAANKIDGQDFLYVGVQPVAAMKGRSGLPDLVNIETPSFGMETPFMEIGDKYLFFLVTRDNEDAKNRPVWDLLPGVPPVLVQEKEKEAFLACARTSVEFVEMSATGPQLKQHFLQMLDSGVSFFQSDASREALQVSDWSSADLALMMQLLVGERKVTISGTVERENLITVIVWQGQPDQILTFVRGQVVAGNTDPIYFGLSRRTDSVVDDILNGLLADPETQVRNGGIRIAGLLRRADIIDSVERRNIDPVIPEISMAIKQARLLVNRDY